MNYTNKFYWHSTTLAMSCLCTCYSLFTEIPREPEGDYGMLGNKTRYKILSFLKGATIATYGDSFKAFPGHVVSAAELNNKDEYGDNNIFVSALDLLKEHREKITPKQLGRIVSESPSMKMNGGHIYAFIDFGIIPGNEFVRIFRKAFSRFPYLRYKKFHKTFDFSRIYFRRQDALEILSKTDHPLITKSPFKILGRGETLGILQDIRNAAEGAGERKLQDACIALVMLMQEKSADAIERATLINARKLNKARDYAVKALQARGIGFDYSWLHPRNQPRKK